MSNSIMSNTTVPNTMKKIFPLMILVVLASPLSASPCEYSKQIERQFDADNIALLKLNVLAGSLLVTGNSGSSQIKFSGEACANEEEYLSRISLDEVVNLSELELTVIIPQNAFGFRSDYAYVDVTVELPQSLMLEIADSSGDMEVNEASARLVDDSSGDIRVRGNKVKLLITDSSGNITVKDSLSDVEIRDSSGEISARNIKGSVLIPIDSSGDIDLSNVTQDVVIDRDSSGNIDINEVGNNVQIGSDGSGSIDIYKVDGFVRINNDGSGSITIRDVEGEVNIGHDGSGRLSVADIGGDFIVGAKGSGGIRSNNVSGKVDVPR